MPLIPRTGRNTLRGRLQIGWLYLTLTAGVVAVVYPLLVVLAGSTRSPVDLGEAGVLPAFLNDDKALYRKFVEALFNESLDAANITYQTTLRSFKELELPKPDFCLVSEWKEFLQQQPPPMYGWTCGMIRSPISRTTPFLLRRFRASLFRRFGGDLEKLNQTLQTDFSEWTSVFVIPEDYYTRRRMPSEEPYLRAFWQFKQEQPWGLRYFFTTEGFYRSLFLRTRYTRDIASYNRAHGTSYQSYRQVPFPTRFPYHLTDAEKRDWEEFVRHTLNVLWIRTDDTALRPYQEYLAARYGDIRRLNQAYNSSYRSFADIPLPEPPPFSGRRLEDWSDFISGWQNPDTGRILQAPLDSLRVISVDEQFRSWLLARYRDISSLNRALGTSFASFGSIIAPQQQSHLEYFLKHRRDLRREFLTRNIRTALDYILVHGRALRNTAIYCGLAVLGALVINPLAAYGLSRYRPASTFRWLLFLMLTMAFPPVVTQIPLFLLLRNLKLLNTFAALVLPGLAHGYSIFLLKGFFDSLPRELYESAALDGAGEWYMFRHIALAMSGPILAVIALQAFTTAYTNFMFALLICQDPRMWTVMVWLYQLQQQAGQPVVYAALLVAALPTLLVFLLCQRVILRGIIIPTEQ